MARGIRGPAVLLVISLSLVTQGCSRPPSMVSTAAAAAGAESGAIRGYLVEWVKQPSAKDRTFSSQELVVLTDGSLYYLESRSAPWRRLAGAGQTPKPRLGVETAAEARNRQDALSAAQRVVGPMYPLLADAVPQVFAYLIRVRMADSSSHDVLVAPDGTGLLDPAELKRWPK